MRERGLTLVTVEDLEHGFDGTSGTQLRVKQVMFFQGCIVVVPLPFPAILCAGLFVFPVLGTAGTEALAYLSKG